MYHNSVLILLRVILSNVELVIFLYSVTLLSLLASTILSLFPPFKKKYHSLVLLAGTEYLQHSVLVCLFQLFLSKPWMA